MGRRLPVAGAITLSLLVAAACGGSSGDDDDDAATGGTGTVLSGGAPGSGGMGQGGSGNASTGDGGTNAAAGKGGGGAAGRGGTSAMGGGGGRATAGAGNAAGTASAGKGGSSSTGGAGPLGSACNDDEDCESGLTCITSDSATLGPFGPAGGLCTMACTDHAECDALTPGAYCVGFDEDAELAFCLEGCTPGEATVPKCQERADMGCNLVGFADSEIECETSDDCGTGQLCDTETGLCAATVTACSPTCAGDFDCQGKRHCDFSSGMCADGSPTGLPFGSICDTSATPDPCNGFCVPTSETGTGGMCMGICTLNPDLIGCGWDGAGDADAACLFQTRLSADGDVGAGDMMICGALCDCNDDCNGLSCIGDDTGTLDAVWGREGYCRPLADDETEADTVACE